ncbi:ACT domain-containing protein [Synechococcales cyanobacterium C]|uniref:ACT domain-containing protein n=1 Tax=Petrachloros mirabilis ULC683 TaxID=2781853 RepID=A0A8K1ZXG1_9CYAN|nr:NAD-dependent malic enzyme [Petrachloros mirabilis]NCJ06693.1 ACT domain-containing protein [Petrachloros mirabilis ULC683]
MVQLTPNSSFSLTIRVQLPNRTGMLAGVVRAIGEAGGSIGHVDLLQQNRKVITREFIVDATSESHGDEILSAIKSQLDVQVLDVYDRTFALHRGGKITVTSKLPLHSQDELAMAYTPGVGRICMAIAQQPERVHDLTIKSNTVAVVTDGSAVLGLGNIGPEAALPVMEGKAMLFQEFGKINAFPVCLATQDVDEIVATIQHMAPVFGGINLEDISAPRCFEIEARLRQTLDIPVFHDDQHGTAIVVLAALFNALKLVNKSMTQIRVVINGAGAAGIAIAVLLSKAGVNAIELCDSRGLLSRDRTDLNPMKQVWACDRSGTLADALVGADVFLGVSAPGVVTPAMVRAMARDPIVFAMANPIPEIQPELVQDDVAVMATGRSDYANQINNVLAFPGIFRGALHCRASTITATMHLQAANAIAALVNATELNREYIIPSVFDERVATAVASAVEQAAREEGIARC